MESKPGLDLVEISPKAKPPVARIVSFDKYRYEQAKAKKKERQVQRATEMKYVQISVRAGKNDLLVRLKQLESFLETGHPVEIRLRMRGRERAHKDWARKKLQEFIDMITTDHKITNAPRFGGRGMFVQIAKK